MERKGRCNNVGICSMAGKVQIITDDDAEFVCSDCGEALEEVTEDVATPSGSTGEKKSKLPIIIAAVVVVLGGGAAALFMGGGDKKEETPAKEPVEQVVTEPVKVDEETPVAIPDGLDLGYAVFQGKVQDGKPHDDNGVLTFKQKHVIESRDLKKREANPGEKVIGIFENGHLVTGKWYKADGNVETLIIGG